MRVDAGNPALINLTGRPVASQMVGGGGGGWMKKFPMSEIGPHRLPRPCTEKGQRLEGSA